MIVGGGISGLYCAMKLIQYKETQPDKFKDLKSIAILERSNRWGGRLDTDIINIDGKSVKEEEGAMRFAYNYDDVKKSNMPLLGELIHELGLEDELTKFYMTPQGADHDLQVNNVNGQYYNGKFFTDWYAEKNPDVWRNLYNLDSNDKYDTPDEIFKDIYTKLLVHNESKIRDHFKEEEAEIILKQEDRELLRQYENADYWTFVRNVFTWPVKGKETTLNQFSMLALMREMGISHQACKMMAQTNPMIKCVNSNAGCNLLDYGSFDILWDDFHQFKRGYSTLVEKVMQSLEETSRKNEVELKMSKNCEVFNLSDSKSNGAGFEISARDRSHGTNQLLQKIDASHLVLAVAPTAVEQILHQSNYREFDNTDIMKLCKATIGLHLTKINLYFEQDWWNKKYDKIIMYGGSGTSLPLESVYPFYADVKDSDGLNHPCPAALTIYCESDLNDAEFWTSMQRLGRKFESPLQSQHPELLAVSEPLLDEAIDQLKKLFNTEEIPQVVLTSYRSWDGQDEAKTNQNDVTRAKYQYAAHYWALGVDDREIVKKAAKPIENKNLHLCNEAWSGYQGWVEGALMSTQKALDSMLPVGIDSEK